MRTMKDAKQTRRTKPKVANYKHPHGARAIQIDAVDGSQVVCFDNLRVLITKSDGSWLAQGLEVDYAVDGDSIPDVKQRFVDGLTQTIAANLRVFSNVSPLLKIAPQEVWDQWNDAKNKLRRFKHTMVVVTPQKQAELPFDQIVWLDATKVA